MAEQERMTPSVVIKVGGSLFDLPHLGSRLRRFVKFQRPRPMVFVPGGGPTAEFVRDLDRQHGLGPAHAHWLALRAVTFNGWFILSLLGQEAKMVGSVMGIRRCWCRRELPVVDGFRFADKDHDKPGALPISWDATSDSLALRVAQKLGASELLLLKSVDGPSTMSCEDAFRAGLVDRHLARGGETPGNAPQTLPTVRCINFRRWRPTRMQQTVLQAPGHARGQ